MGGNAILILLLARPSTILCRLYFLSLKLETKRLNLYAAPHLRVYHLLTSGAPN
uniref:Organic solute transporter alpha-like protein n=1 Tax=Parascaris univalens TaxID=6257 RepID=A0A915AQC5_PARUN